MSKNKQAAPKPKFAIGSTVLFGDTGWEVMKYAKLPDSSGAVLKMDWYIVFQNRETREKAVLTIRALERATYKTKE